MIFYLVLLVYFVYLNNNSDVSKNNKKSINLLIIYLYFNRPLINRMFLQSLN